MRILIAAAVFAAVAVSALAAPANMTIQLPSADPGAPDPFAWLEDIHAPRAMAWVEKQNARTAAVLETDPRYALFRRQALAIFTAKDRIPYPRFLGSGVDNFWQDQTHVKGLWRRASFASFNSSDPTWETLIDFDALSKAEGKNWIFKGATCLPPTDRLCLVHMSNGGGDAVEIREYDTEARAFVPGGFRFVAGKQDVEWLDADTLLIARDFGPGTLTASGYPFVVKALKRGQPLADAKEVFRGTPHDVSADPVVLRGPEGSVEHVLYRRGVAFFSTRYWLATPEGGTRSLDLPRKGRAARLRGPPHDPVGERGLAGRARPSGLQGRRSCRLRPRRGFRRVDLPSFGDPDRQRGGGDPEPPAGRASRQRQRRA